MRRICFTAIIPYSELSDGEKSWGEFSYCKKVYGECSGYGCCYHIISAIVPSRPSSGVFRSTCWTEPFFNQGCRLFSFHCLGISCLVSRRSIYTQGKPLQLKCDNYKDGDNSPHINDVNKWFSLTIVFIKIFQNCFTWRIWFWKIWDVKFHRLIFFLKWKLKI